MIDLRLLRNDPDRVAENCRNRGLNLDISHLLKLDEHVREAQTELERIRQRRNQISGQMKGKLPQEERQPLIEEAKTLRGEEQGQEARFRMPHLELPMKIPGPSDRWATPASSALNPRIMSS